MLGRFVSSQSISMVGDGVSEGDWVGKVVGSNEGALLGAVGARVKVGDRV